MSQALDLFAGAGGWDVAAERLGIHTCGVENMKEARATRDAVGHCTVHDDVWTYFDAHPRLLARAILDGLIASPPCQTFSVAGKGAGRKALDTVLDAIERGLYHSLGTLRELGEHTDPRTALVLTPLHYAIKLKPEWIAFEQVPTVLPVWEACAEVLRNHGYSVWTGNVQAEQYGDPQTRKRAILVASRVREVGRPKPTHSKYYTRDKTRLDPGVKKWVTMAEALNGFGLSGRPSPTITGGGTETGGAEPIAKLARYTDRPDWHERTLARAGATAQKGHSSSDFRYEWHQRSNYNDGSKGSEGRDRATRELDQPSVTIASKGFQWSDETRHQRVTVQEAGVLQSFPADYPWQGAKGKQYLQVGNAIPVGLATAVLKEAIGFEEADHR